MYNDFNVNLKSLERAIVCDWTRNIYITIIVFNGLKRVRKSAEDAGVAAEFLWNFFSHSLAPLLRQIVVT